METKISEKAFSKLPKMPASIEALHEACRARKGFCKLQEKAAKAGIEVKSGFIQYSKYALNGAVHFALDRVVLNLSCPDSSDTASGWHVYFKEDHYGDRTHPEANKLHLDCRIHSGMNVEEMLKAQAEINALVSFVAWFNAQKIEKLLPVFGKTVEAC